MRVKAVLELKIEAESLEALGHRLQGLANEVSNRQFNLKLDFSRRCETTNTHAVITLEKE